MKEHPELAEEIVDIYIYFVTEYEDNKSSSVNEYELLVDSINDLIEKNKDE